MRLNSSKTLYAYWNELRGTRLAPHRFEIEPSRIADILPETFILEKVSPTQFRYRLAGTRVCERLGSEFRGTNFLARWNADDRYTIERDLSAVANHGATLTADAQATYLDGERIVFEFLVLPLFHTGNTIERLMGVVSSTTRIDPLVPLSLKSLKLLDTHLHWPAQNTDKPAVEQLPSVFEPHVRTARVVRHDRRSFRVYDGGLSADPKGGE